MWTRWDIPQNLILTFIDELEKQLFIEKKNCWSGPIKNVRILIFTMLYLKKKKERKTPRDTILLQLSMEILMIWSTDVERDRLKLVILGHFLPF